MASKEQEIYFIGGGGCGESRKIGAGERLARLPSSNVICLYEAGIIFSLRRTTRNEYCVAFKNTSGKYTYHLL